jgi:hypothetical protein
MMWKMLTFERRIKIHGLIEAEYEQIDLVISVSCRSRRANPPIHQRREGDLVNLLDIMQYPPTVTPARN